MAAPKKRTAAKQTSTTRKKGGKMTRSQGSYARGLERTLGLEYVSREFRDVVQESLDMISLNGSCAYVSDEGFRAVVWYVAFMRANEAHRERVEQETIRL
jgi:hypothetical protein